MAVLRVLVPVLVLFSVPAARGQEKPPRAEFNTLIAHWAEYEGDDYLEFVRDARPDVAQLGFYGGHFWSLAHTPQYNGYPAHFPVQGLKECGDWMETRNKAVQQMGVKVVGHFNVEFLVGEPDGAEGPRGFFKFYRELWNEQELGPKPVADPLELLEKDIDGQPIVHNSYNIGGMREYWACLRNPHWQTVLKAWTKRAIERGVDGLMINYFYRHDCHCEHCQRGFREYLAERYSAEELQERFQIEDVKTHQFPELVSWHKPEESTPLRREMLRWSQISNKQVFDEVFVKYGRSLKPDLMLAQWNHLGNFSQINGDERCLLPGELWGRDEDYLWYSTGGAACFTDLKENFLGDVTLQARYIRGAFDDKPFTIGKYEHTRIRSAIAELAANGGAPMGFYTRFREPEARVEIVRYYQFIRRYGDLYRANHPHAEVALIFPRSLIHEGHVAFMETFRQLGRQLLESHILFDVIPDDLATVERLKPYAVVVHPEFPGQLPARDDARLSRFTAPVTVRVSATRPAQGDELTVHLVNYNRTEPPRDTNDKPATGRGIMDEQPIAAKDVQLDLVIPAGKKVTTVEFLTPESPEPKLLEILPVSGRLTCQVPEFLVYCVVRVRLEAGK